MYINDYIKYFPFANPQQLALCIRTSLKVKSAEYT